MKKKRILFLPQQSDHGASSRVRLYTYLPFLKDQDILYRTIPGVSLSLDKKMSKSPSIFIKVLWFLSLAANRTRAAFCAPFYDVVFLQRETLPYLFPLIDLLICAFSKKVIFDFDDAIYMRATPENRIKSFFHDKNNIAGILKLCDKVIVSNSYLAEYAKKYNNNVFIIPTTILRADFAELAQRATDNTLPVIGWMGSCSTAKYLKIVENALKNLAQKYDFIFRIVGAENISIVGVTVECKQWRKEQQLIDLVSFDIGIMPLTNDPWTRGKAGFKLLQYMGAHVACVASPVGINTEIIQDGINGMLAANEQEWVEKLEFLLTHPHERKIIAAAGRDNVLQQYVLEAYAEKMDKNSY